LFLLTSRDVGHVARMRVMVVNCISVLVNKYEFRRVSYFDFSGGYALLRFALVGKNKRVSNFLFFTHQPRKGRERSEPTHFDFDTYRFYHFQQNHHKLI